MEKRRREVTRKSEAATSFEPIAREWFELNKGRWTDWHAGNVLRSLERDIFPKIGHIPLASIDAPLLFDVLHAIENRGSIETAKRIRQRISAVFLYAISRGLAADDPAATITKALKPKPKQKRQPAVTDLDELRRLLRTVEQANASPVTLLASPPASRLRQAS